ncbi:hypothetical protein K435DRAFT_854077 [Dendrothele bispora CBS 962.96]|uniref:Uncharacterized protein n=1 Tax=Dendrothele bispora (strain CBS 962.96) TaxID=1314807 RepID=A0A4S8MG65_DENBC|nr:hypothetical protein K435DRAFT_854077 [Dendrothele bispora CBS 962.96]
MELLPYNVTLSSQTACSIRYNPAPNLSANQTTGWKVSYTDGVRDLDYGNDVGVGVDLHQSSLENATMELDWVGTAVYLYGDANVGSYTISVDDGEETPGTPIGGLLGSKSSLQYGPHKISLRVVGGNLVSFQYAEATIGVGYPQSSPQNTTILAVKEDGTRNDFFAYSSNPSPGTEGWNVEIQESKPMPNGTTIPFPRQMRTNTKNATVSFTLTNTTAFFLRGAVNYDHTTKNAILTSNKDGSSENTTINDFSTIFDFGQILYWKSDLNRNETYNVQITNVDDSKFFSFGSLDLIDGYVPFNRVRE